jgi:hypothetical protein
MPKTKLVELNQPMEQTNIYTRIQKQISVVLAIVVIVALGANLGLLTILGTKGDELSSIRAAQEEQKLKNDLLRAKIEALKVNSQLEEKARQELDMADSDIIVIEKDNTQVVASQ